MSSPSACGVAGDRGAARKGDYRAARVGAAGALVLVLIFMLVVDAMSPTYEVSPLILLPILGTIGALLGIEVSNTLRGDYKP